MLNYLGCLESDQSQDIYKAVGGNHSLFTSYIFKIIGLISSGLFGLSAAFPISYAIFGYPAPQSWLLVLETQ